jgi:hypothetical protein
VKPQFQRLTLQLTALQRVLDVQLFQQLLHLRPLLSLQQPRVVVLLPPKPRLYQPLLLINIELILLLR